MRVVIDGELCAGHGRCYSLVPDLFDSDEQGHGVVLFSGALTHDQLAMARNAALNCPEQAINVLDE